MENGVPVGTVMPYFGTMKSMLALEKEGWLYCNGSEKNEHDWPELHDLIEWTYGGHDNMFGLPDLRGMFLRGVDDARGLDPEAKDRLTYYKTKGGDELAGTVQADAIKAHDHLHKGWYRVSSGNDRQCLSRPWLDGDDPVGFPMAEPKLETRPVNIACFYIIKARS